VGVEVFWIEGCQPNVFVIKRGICSKAPCTATDVSSRLCGRNDGDFLVIRFAHSKLSLADLSAGERGAISLPFEVESNGARRIGG
jgi:hypothetical protein